MKMIMKKIKRNFVVACILSSCLLLMSSKAFGPPAVSDFSGYVPYLMEGANHRYSMMVAADPPAHFRCYIEGMTILDPDRFEKKFDGNIASLKITNIRVSDRGKLTFEFTNSCGETKTSVNVIVFPWSN